MTDTLKVLGQSAPAAATLTTLYTVPAATSTVTSSLSIANESATPDTVRVSVAVAGAADNAKQYIYYDLAVPGKGAGVNTQILPLGLTLAATDVVRCYSANGTTTAFSLFGVEIT